MEIYKITIEYLAQTDNKSEFYHNDEIFITTDELKFGYVENFVKNEIYFKHKNYPDFKLLDLDIITEEITVNHLCI